MNVVNNLLFSVSLVSYLNLIIFSFLRTLRLLARNNRLNEIKNLMQESVGHGAPSPKLVKLEEIILQHFRKILLSILICVVSRLLR